jgi:NTE family protein
VTGTPRIGLVLGAGGVLGHAFHVGVLKALEEATGWDPRDAAVIVGTSAGSHVAAYLRAGASAADLAARVAGEGAALRDRELHRRLGDPFPVPPPRPALGMAAPRLVARGLVRPWTTLPGAVVAAALPRGRVSLRSFAARINWLFTDGGWPAQPLWLPAVDLRRGRLVVFGREDAPATDVGTAVAASCAVPGWFAPVEVAGVPYVDGGARSVTNLDLLAGQELDLVVVSSPMSVGRRAGPRVDTGARWSLRLRLGQEARALRRRGTAVVAFQPTPADVAVMGWNGMDPSRRREVVRQAYESASHRLRRPSSLARLEPLVQAASAASSSSSSPSSTPRTSTSTSSTPSRSAVTPTVTFPS